MRKITDDITGYDLDDSKEIIEHIKKLTNTSATDEHLSKMITESAYITAKANKYVAELFDELTSNYQPGTILLAQAGIISKMLEQSAICFLATTLAMSSCRNTDSEKVKELILGLNTGFFASIDIAKEEIKESRLLEFSDAMQEMYKLTLDNKNKKK